MASMIEFLHKKAPNTTTRFLLDLSTTKGIGTKEFESKQMWERLSYIKGYLGYCKYVDKSLEQDIIKKDIITLFEEFESLIIKYPNGVPNFLKVLNEMSNSDKTEYFEKNYIRQINISLNHALVPNNRLNRPSLKDSLKSRVLSTIEQISLNKLESSRIEQEFWEMTIKEFKKELIPPF